MIFTCESKSKMGYIYLMPFINHKNIYDFYKKDLINKDLIKYIDIESINISISSDFQYENILSMMKISNITYQEASINGQEFTEEYQNDLDLNGYLAGVELNLSKHKFLKLIKDNALQIFKYNWNNKDFILLTLDEPKNVFDITNIIYPFSNKNDAFAIVKLEEQYQIGFIKGIISSREDLYPLTYLCKPEFILWDN